MIEKRSDPAEAFSRASLAMRHSPSTRSAHLPKIALAILQAQPRIVGNPYVFASGEKKHFNSWSQRKQELDAVVKIPHWVGSPGLSQQGE